ncbi:MAG TPA: hypothetical protein VLF79_02705 [Candidatus Saccharimonadales bacterium]|nr:hypothetical protein [Candidatus Saccharimonadales bacterium]
MDNQSPPVSNQPTSSASPPAPATAAAALPSVPDTYPGAFGLYNYSKAAIKQNTSTVVLLIVLSLLISIIINAIFSGSSTRGVGSLIVDLVSVLFSTALTLTYLAGVRREKLSFSDSITQSFPYYLKFLGLTLLIVLSAIVSFLLLIIPFFFVVPRLVLSPYYLLDKNMGIIDAYKASWDFTKGHVAKVYGIVGVNILIALLLVTIIGIPFAIYFWIMYSAAFAVLYKFIDGHSPTQVSAPTNATPATPTTLPVETPPSPTAPTEPPSTPSP